MHKRYEQVREKINEAAARAGREPGEITLIPVSKNHGIEKIKYFHRQGLGVFGENRVQELTEKDDQITEFPVKWHFIGHLQRNKVKYLMRMDNCIMVQSLDSWRLAREINKRARKNNRAMPVLVEVNVSGDDNKYGIKPVDTLEFIKKASKLEWIEIKGLMTLAPYLEDLEAVRPYFRQLRELKDQAVNEGFELRELSMGMSNDFEVAIEEGATIVRIGTALFGQRDYN